MMHEKKKYNKIRKYLGNDYHLYEEYPSKKWKLFLKYDGYLYDGSEPIMTSDNYTYEELYKFAKKHKTYDSETIILRVFLIISILLMILSIINIFLNSVYIRGFINGADFMIIVAGVCCINITNHNIYVLNLKIEERRKRVIQNMKKKTTRK